MIQGPWWIGEPGGPSGPFYSVVSATGRVIAMQIPDRSMAQAISALPDMLHALMAALEPAGDTPEQVRAEMLAAVRKATGETV